MIVIPLSLLIETGDLGYYRDRRILDVSMTERGYEILVPGLEGLADAEWVLVGYDALVDTPRNRPIQN
ncbi:MAG: hypothetical protein WCI67_08570 [Chloroflexales bacterium]